MYPVYRFRKCPCTILYIIYIVSVSKNENKTLCSIYFFYCLDNILERSAAVISVQYNCIYIYVFVLFFPSINF